MENIKRNILETESNTNSVDIITIITEFVSYLKNNENCQTLLKLSEIELQNELEFKQRAEKILKHCHCHDLIISEEKLMNEQQNNIKVITSDMETEIGKEKLDPTNISEIYQNMLILKMCNINDSKHTKYLEDFMKINKINLKQMSKIKKEIKSVLYNLPSKSKSHKKSNIKIAHTTNFPKDNASWISSSNTQDNNSQTQPIIYEEHVRFKFENDSRTMDNNRIYIGQTRRRRNYENIDSLDSTISSADDDFVEYSCLNNTPNLSKDIEENNRGDVHLILNPIDT